MKILLLIILATIVPLMGSGLSRENSEIIENFRKGKKIEEPSKRKFMRLEKVKEGGLPSLKEYLFLIQNAQKKDLGILVELRKIHSLKTFEAIYGKDAEAVKAFDEHKFYVQALNNKIEGLTSDKLGEGSSKEEK